MPEKLRRILCMLGFHDWDNGRGKAFGDKRTCRRSDCGRREVLEPDMWNAGCWVKDMEEKHDA